MTYAGVPRVNAFIDDLAAWQQTICREVRELIHAADPDVTETIKRRALTAMFKQIVANNRAGGWRKLKRKR